jgi:hypothetical protein
VEINTTINNNTVNVYPPPPNPESDEACQAAHYLARQLTGELVGGWLDAASISLQEWITAILGLGGWNASLAILWWNWMIATSDPDFVTQAEAAADEIAQNLYCNDLSINALKSDIPSLSIDANVKTSLSLMLDSIEAGKIALWIATGQLTEAGNSCDTCGGWEQVFNFTAGNGGWAAYNAGAVLIGGAGWQRGGTVTRFTLSSPAVSTTVTYVKAEYSTTWSGASTSGNVFYRLANAANTSVLPVLANIYSGAVTWGTWERDGLNVTLSNQRFHIAHASNSGFTSPAIPLDFYLTRVTLRGTGTNPF